MQRSQHGASDIFIAIVLLLVAVAVIATLTLSRGVRQNERGTKAVASLKAGQDALTQFVAANGRLPCPANPAVDSGDAEPDAASATCTFDQGTVPWHTIGLKREDALDPWSNKVSYRVYTGAAGSLTQAEGASMVQCDTVESLPADISPRSGSSGGICRTTQNTLDTQFMAAGKGFSVNNFAAPVTGVAYVLISHGPTGRGAFTSAGVQQELPAGTDETTNLSAVAAPAFIARAQSDPSIPVTAAAFFDDTVAYATLSDLISKSGRSARDWPEAFGGIRFDAPNLTAVTGSPPSGSMGTTLNYSSGVVSTSTGTFNYTSAGYEGIGITSGVLDLNPQISSLNAEKVRVKFNRGARWYSMSLLNFAKTEVVVGPITAAAYVEKVQLTFFKAGVSLGSVNKVGCSNAVVGQFISGSEDTRASFDSIDVQALLGDEFDEVLIAPQQAELTVGTPLLGVLPTQFYLSEIKTCGTADTLCRTGLSVANPATVCP